MHFVLCHSPGRLVRAAGGLSVVKDSEVLSGYQGKDWVDVCCR